MGQHSNEEGFKHVNGVELYYKSLGEGEPILVVHGGPGLDEGYLHPGIDPLSKKYRIITYDQRGSGRSKGTLDTSMLTLDQYVEDIEGLRKTLGLKKIHLMGHSFGGLMSLLYACKYPEHLQSLILVGSGAKDSSLVAKVSKTVDERMTQADKDTVAKMTSAGYFNTMEGRSKLFPILWKPYVYDKEKIKLISTAINDSFLFISNHVRKTIATSSLYDKLNERLILLHIPALIIQGDYDPLPLSAAETNHRVLKGSQLVVLENCGHFPFLEQQEVFTKVVYDFLHFMNK
jgi:proline iminopeptidase